MAKKDEKPDTIKQLFGYAGNYRYLTILSWILSAISSWIALAPFYFIWRIIKEVLRVAPHYDKAQNLAAYGWEAVGFSILAMLAFMEVPYYLNAYYKWKYPEEYREWEGKSLEEWYGKKYLKKHKELLEHE